MSGRNSTSPPPPPSPQSNATAPASPTPPPPQTNATASPPPTTPTNDASPPPPLINSASPTESPPPPPRVESNSPPGSGGMPTTATVGIIVGVGIGAFCMLLAVGVIFLFYRRRKRRRARTQESGDYPPEPKNDQFNQHFQQNYAPPLAGKLMFPKPTPPPPPGLSSTSTSLGSEKPPSGPSPGIAYGLSQISFTYEELLMATNGFSDANLLGQGGFGYVHKGVLPNGKVVAIKHLKAGSGQGEREFQAEIEVISRVHHRHLVSLVGYCSSGVQRMLIYEFVSNDTLEFHLHGKGRPTMDWQTRLKIALGSAKGLAYLHEDCQPKIIHRDIKAANILLDDSFEAKVADFGLAKFSSDLDTHVSTRVMGTFGYLAPEYASSGKLTEKSDVFSFGVVLLELITGRRPVDRTESFADDSMVEWARPLLAQALETGNSSALVDTRLQNDYNASEMACVLACAAACVRHSGKRRPRMSQVVRALEGNLSPEELNEGVIPGHSTVFSLNSYGSTEYSTSEYKADMMKFRKLALESEEQEQGTSETSGPSSEFGVHQSASSGEGQQSTQEFGRTKKEA